MSRLASLLEEQSETLMRRWVDRLRHGIAPGGETETELRDHIPLFLRELTQALRHQRPVTSSPAAEEHGRQRHRIGFDVEALVREYGVLRTIILDMVEEEDLGVTLAEVRVLTDFISHAIAEGVTEYGHQRRLRERAQVEAAHAGAEAEREKLIRLFSEAPVGIAILDGPEHVFTFANPAYRTLVGGRDVVGKPLLEALPEIDGQGFDELFDRVMATGAPFYGYAQPATLVRDGKPEACWFNFVFSPKHSASGQIDGVMQCAFEVTTQVLARQRVEALAESLRVSEARYRALFASIDDAYCLIELIVDERGQTRDYLFLEANAAFETQTGLKDAVGKTIVELVPDISTSWFEIYGRVVATGETQRFENHDPALHRWFDAYASRVEPADRRQVAIVFKDITARKLAEAERERLLGELARSNTALDQFAYVASHDLKAPLRGIANLSHWIEDDLGDAVTDDARDKLGLLRGRVHRLEDLINGILDYSVAGRSQARPEPVDTGKLAADVIELLAPPDHIAFSVADAMPTVVAERVPLQQVFMNLIGNAVKYNPAPGAAVRVDAADEGAAVHFTVADNGPGIAPEHHERIWGIFQKLKARDVVEGTGIGLSVVKRIVESRGGRTWVESSEGAGATFHVVWPRQPVAG